MTFFLKLCEYPQGCQYILFFCEKDRSGALFCFFSKKSESVEPDPIGFRPKSLINSTTGTITDIHIKVLKIELYSLLNSVSFKGVTLAKQFGITE